MSYLAIARKYRPATFDEIVGQAHVTRTLRNALANHRIHHAYLFCGARGVGKTTAARAFAKSLNCVNGPTPDPCGECVSCREIASGTSPDLIEIDGASNNSVDDVRDLRDNVGYLPTRGKYKIYLVDEVHMLSKAAFNALLKTLEEPPAHIVFLFATTEPAKIPDTILSRVQRFDFKRIPIAAVVQRLQSIAASEGASVSEASLRLIARAGEGSMRDAQSLLDKVISFAGAGAVSDSEVTEILGLIDRTLLHRTLEGLVKGDAAAVLEVVDTVYGYGFELAQFSEELMEVVRNATFLRLSEAARKYVDIPDDEVAQLAKIVEGVEAEQLQRLFSALIDVHDQVSRAARPRLVLEMAVARLATPRPVVPVGALVQRLEDLERRARHAKKAQGAGPIGRRPRT
ncbi:MAG: DNA polymerase III subunit gamma/tau [Alphaproteobacteria bacterium]|nr:DNA polymerase III subunit gamma/tau [Alphaproteobacteria bacterium]